MLVLHSPNALPIFVDSHQVFSHALAVFAYDDDAHFGLLTSSVHWWWAVTQSGTLGGEANIRYNINRAFKTFPPPDAKRGASWEAVNIAGRYLDHFRSDLMIRTGLGLTKTYNRVRSPSEHNPDVVRLRDLHVDLDRAVLDAYGWSDLDLDHRHWETAQGMRFTVSPEAKDELLDRLLELNRERYAAEVAAGLHDKKSSAKRPRKPTDGSQETLL